jgi:hypothetical protein
MKKIRQLLTSLWVRCRDDVWAKVAAGLASAILLGWSWCGQPVVDSSRDWLYATSGQLASVRINKTQGFKYFEAGKAFEGQIAYARAAAILLSIIDRYDNSEALFELGKLTCVGWGVQKNQTLAKHYFGRARLDKVREARLLNVPDLAGCWEPTPTKVARA